MTVVHTELRDSIDLLVGNPVIQELARDWVRAAAGAGIPSFAEFGPEHRQRLAGNLMVLTPDDGAFRYAYYGPRIAEVAGFDMTGRLTRDFGGEVGDYFETKYREVLASGRPLYTVHHAEQVSAVVSWERIILPVRDADGRTVIVCYNVPLDSKAEIFDALLAASMDGIVVLQPIHGRGGVIEDFRYILVNRRAGAILNRDPESLIGGTIMTVFPQASDRLPVYREVMESSEPRQFEIESALDGTDRVFRLSAVRAGGKVVVTLSDITEMRRLLQQLERQQAELLQVNETLEQQASHLVELVESIDEAHGAAHAAARFVTDLMEAVPVPLFHWTLDGAIGRANSHYAALYGHTRESIVGKTPEDILPPHLAKLIRDSNAELMRDAGIGAETADVRQVYEAEVDFPNLGTRHVVVHRALLHGVDDEPTGIVGAVLDDTEEYTLRKELERLASTDPLTGLYNRRVFMDRLETEIARCRRSDGECAVVLLDVDHFKRVNDSFGHDIGDKVLIGLAELLTNESRDGIDAPARFGGEEFVILVPDADSAAAAAFADRLRERFVAMSFATPSGPRQCSASFGVASLARGEAVASLLKRTDEALYASKSRGRNRVTIAPLPEAALIPLRSRV